MKRVLVWDLPVRLFHVLLAAGAIAAFTIAQVVDDDSSLFSAHMIIGLVLAHLVLLRIVWGVVGSRHARFSALPLGPRAVFGYVADALRGRAARHAGHNPGAAVVLVVVLACVLGLAVTGVLMGRGVEAAEGLHGVFAYVLVAAVVAHLAGVALHTVRHKEAIFLSMVDGKKVAEPEQAIVGARPLVGGVLVVVAAVVSVHLVRSFDPATRQLSLPLFGVLQLGEVEDEHGGEHGDRSRERHHDDD